MPRGRLQYRYHPDWTTFRDRVKFDHLPAFANALPSVRKRIDADLALAGRAARQGAGDGRGALADDAHPRRERGVPRENGAYGLTTFRNRHAKVSGSEIAFVFTGKSGIAHEVRARDRRVAKVLRECQEIPGQRLFQYLDDDGVPTPVHSHDVNEYLREIADADITAKDFRTWVATVATASALGPLDPPSSEKEERAMVKAVDRGGRGRPRQHPHGLSGLVRAPTRAGGLPDRRAPRGVVDHSPAQGAADPRRAPHRTRSWASGLGSAPKRSREGSARRAS